MPDLGALSGKLDKIIELLKQPNVVQNNTFNQSIGSADADLFRRLRSQSLEDLKTVANQIKIF
jgi:hypothetical protein